MRSAALRCTTAAMVAGMSTLRLRRMGTLGNGSSPVGGPTKPPPLPGMHAASRVAMPTQDSPATWSEEEPLDPTDPRIIWREHYSVADGKPYYENVMTNVVTYDIPEGFVTRFPRHYENNGYRVDHRGAVFRSPQQAPDAKDDTAVPDVSAKRPEHVTLTMKQKLATYGAGGILWYLIVHNISLAWVFCCLYFSLIDLVGIARSYGFDVKAAESKAPLTDGKHHRPSFWKTLVLAILLNKILVPAHLFITITTAPLTVRRLEPVAARVIPRFKSLYTSTIQKLKANLSTPQSA